MTDKTPSGDAPVKSSGRCRIHLIWAISLFLLGLAMKLALIQRCENSLPFYDQWVAEGVDIYIPFFEHHLSLADMFRASNEHRVFWTRVYDLGLLLLNGQWDSQVQIVANAIIHCAILSGFGWLMAGLLGTRTWPFIGLPLLLALALPYAWENTLWGFQSQFYFLILFSFLMIRLLGSNQPWSPRWRLGVLVAFVGLFSMASGFLATVAVAGIVMIEIFRTPTIWKRQAPTLVVCGLVTVAGLLLKVDVPRHSDLKAHSLRDFVVALGEYFAWPNQQTVWLAPLNLSPFVLLGFLYLRSRGDKRPAEQMVLGVGLWVLLQDLACAYARGGNAMAPASRYMDTCSFLLIVNCLSIILIFNRYRHRLPFAPAWLGVCAIWVVVAGVGLWLITVNGCKSPLQSWIAWQRERTRTTRAFVATDNEQCFNIPDRFGIPFPNLTALTYLLRAPAIRTILPASVREPLMVVHNQTGVMGFVTNGCNLNVPDPPTETSWGSFSGLGVQTRRAFESMPIEKSALPYLEISVAGDLGKPDLSLILEDQVTGKTTPVSPPRTPGKEWLSVYVRAPAHQFRIVARDGSSTGWFAFKAPREVGWLSYWAMNLISAWKGILAAGLVCLCWAVFRLFIRTSTGSKSDEVPREISGIIRS
ncbi:MAG TPA: hypothetical protein VN281_20500 [Verrucomicrobiae bacterium]|nr:hypothetical protein [Verrucomicrobiae bacterium]